MEKALEELVARARGLDAEYHRLETALKEAHAESNRAHCAAVNAWNEVHKALRSELRAGTPLRASDLGEALDPTTRGQAE